MARIRPGRARSAPPRYILDLLARIVTVRVETVRIVESLPRIDFGTA